MKKIIIDQETIDKRIEEFTASLREKLSGKMSTAKISFQEDVNPSIKLTEEEKVTLFFSAVAEKKQAELIQQCEKEVGWHGVVTRLSDKEFMVEDILVFPQVVTGSTVTPAATEYTNWQNSLSDEEFNHMRFHGHSHVNMGVSPSGTDTGFQDNLVQNVKDFYIFLITNKSGDIWLSIYDVENNTLYENSDINYTYYQTPEAAWAKKELEKVRTQTYTAPKTNYGSGVGIYGGNYGYYGGARDYDETYQGYYGYGKNNKNTKGGVTYDE